MITNPFSHIGQFGALLDDLAGKRHDLGHQAAAVAPPYPPASSNPATGVPY
jgi:hypothetical protein